METSAEEPSPFFVMQCYGDVEQLPRCLKQLRRHYPKERVLVISDGFEDRTIASIGARYGVEVEMGERLFTAEHGGAAVHRLIARFLDGPEPVMLKIDPDTDVVGRVKFSAEDFDIPSVSGTIQYAGVAPRRLVSVQGGCIIVNRLAAERIMASGVLLGQDMGPPDFIWAVNAMLQERARQMGLTSHDWTLGYACKALGIRVEAKSDVYSVWRPRLADWRQSRSGYAIVHPHMNLGICLYQEAKRLVKRMLRLTH